MPRLRSQLTVIRQNVSEADRALAAIGSLYVELHDFQAPLHPRTAVKLEKELEAKKLRLIEKLEVALQHARGL